jgi:multiple sugar transport system substrate-binding protein
MEEIELSIFDHGTETVAQIQALLGQLETEQSVRVHLDVLPWKGGWSKMVQAALYQDGPDVSEIGSTWISDFVKMNALSPFSPQEIRAIGGKDHFLASSWQSGTTSSGIKRSSPTPWAIPWSADTRVVFYRRDLLQQAGIDEASAFQNPERFEQTLARLKSSGVQTPLAIPTLRSRISVHSLASWVWSTGGDFISQDGAQSVFSQSKALEGMKSYFRLGRYLSKEAQGLDDSQADEMFWRGNAAVTLSGHWLLQEIRMPPEVADNLGIALVPGVSFVGGSHLAIWKHTRQKRAAVKLISCLADSQAVLSLFPSFGLPARLDVLASPSLSEDPHYRVMSQALKTGRSFPSEHQWGLIENRLTDAVPLIWKDVLATPEPDLDEILSHHLDPLVRRIAMALNP